MYGSRGAVEPMAGLAVQLRALALQVRLYATLNGAADEDGDAPVATGVMTTGGWR
jgi:hypothetical protein